MNNEYNFYMINDSDIVATKLNLVSTLIWYESNVTEIIETSDVVYKCGNDITYLPKSELTLNDIQTFGKYLLEVPGKSRHFGLTYIDLARVFAKDLENKDVFVVSSYE